MKKYLIRIGLFFTIIFVIDLAYGKICDYLRDHTKGGFSGNIHYICEKCDEDIIMMGSSRMRHHYVPQIFEDSLGMSCYNTGIDGNGIILSYGFLEMILERYTPKMIIYDVTGFDMYEDDNSKYLGSLKAYYNRAGIADIFNDVNPDEKYKMMSNLYRYNSNLLGLIGDNLHPMQTFDKGYWPSMKVMDYDPEEPTYKEEIIDSLKLQYVEKFIDYTKQRHIKMVFVASPTFFGHRMIHYNDPVKQICEMKDVPFVDAFYDKDLCNNREYWSDATHLNDTGAKLFSNKYASVIREQYNKHGR